MSQARLHAGRGGGGFNGWTAGRPTPRTRRTPVLIEGHQRTPGICATADSRLCLVVAAPRRWPATLRHQWAPKSDAGTALALPGRVAPWPLIATAARIPANLHLHCLSSTVQAPRGGRDLGSGDHVRRQTRSAPARISTSRVSDCNSHRPSPFPRFGSLTAPRSTPRHRYHCYHYCYHAAPPERPSTSAPAIRGNATSNQSQGEYIPAEGDWPVDPQHDVEVSDQRVWVDGCFDFAHHGMPVVTTPSRACSSPRRPCRRHAAGPPAGQRAAGRRALGRGHSREQRPHRHAPQRTVRLVLNSMYDTG